MLFKFTKVENLVDLYLFIHKVKRNYKPHKTLLDKKKINEKWPFQHIQSVFLLKHARRNPGATGKSSYFNFIEDYVRQFEKN